MEATLTFRKSSYSNPSQNCVEIAWRKSSFSGGDNGSQCVEVGWQKSSYCKIDSDLCVEVKQEPGATHIRDSKNPAAGMLTVPVTQFAAFLRQFA